MSRLILVIAAVLTAAPALAEISASQAYMDIHKKELAATCYEDCLKFRTKRSIAKDPPLSKEETVGLFNLMKAVMVQDVKVESEEKKGDEAILHATATGGGLLPGSAPAQGTITMLLENGEWKLDSEKWESKSP